MPRTPGQLITRINAPETRELGDAQLAHLAAIVGHGNVLGGSPDTDRYVREWRDRYVGRAAAVVRPGTTEEVSRILAFANAQGIGIVPQGGNTGLVGGQVPDASGTQVVLSLERMNRLRHLAPSGGHILVEAGATLAQVQAWARDAGRLFPLSMASEGSCQIGGNLATNAGGIAVLAYGTARAQVLGLEVVLADGRIWSGLGALAKDNTGYDLRDLFIGSEGTLGIITAASLKLQPRPREVATTFAGLASLKDVHRLFNQARDACGPMLTAFEFMSARAQSFALAFVPGSRNPLSQAFPWTVLLDVSSPEEGLAMRTMERVQAEAMQAGIVQEAAIAASLAQATDMWRLREAMSDAQKPEGGSIKHDISVPVEAILTFVEEAGRAVEAVCPGARPVPFGHFGDGNIHYNVSQPIGMDKAAFLALWEPMQTAVHDVVRRLSGSISAEHGIGQMKRAELANTKSPVALDMMRAIKVALDPKGILNPCKVL